MLISILSIVNQARALRLAEIMNDYRTLLLHIPQQDVDAPPEDYWEEGYVVIRECLAAAQRLMSSNFCPGSSTASSPNDQEAEKAEFQGYPCASLCVPYWTNALTSMTV